MGPVICIVEARDQLGEGPMWDPASGRLYWFDIKGRRLHWCEPGNGGFGEWPLDVRASAAVRRASGGLVLATEAGLAEFDTGSGQLSIRQPLEPLPEGFRSNDGKIDVFGGFWWSVMDDAAGARPGRLYRTGSDWRTERMVEEVHIANTVSCSPDGRTFYFADTLEQVMYAYDFDPQAVRLSARREFIHTRGQAATPDGSAVDAEGFVWNAQWGGWRVVRYAPDGSVDRVIDLPVEQPTSCAFGGPDLTTLSVTSAWEDLSEADRAKQPLAGGLFAAETGIRGLELPAFEG